MHDKLRTLWRKREDIQYLLRRESDELDERTALGQDLSKARDARERAVYASDPISNPIAV